MNWITSELCDLIKLCTNQNSFVFNGKHYKQLDGLAMGSPLSPVLAEIYMDNFEKLLFCNKNPLLKNIVKWYRYVDDVFCVWQGTLRQLSQFLTVLNSQDKHIKFTMETEEEGVLNYLDMSIRIINHKFDFAIYRKKCYSDSIIHERSRHHIQQKTAALKSLIHRVCHIPMSESSMANELRTIKDIAVNNGYKEKLVDTIFRRKRTQMARRLIYKTQSSPGGSPKWCRIPFLGNLSLKVQRLLPKEKIRPAFYNHRTLRSILGSPKDQEIPEERSGVYRLNCNDCDAIYIGQTGRSFSTRAAEHQMCHRQGKDHSNFAKHLNDMGHISDFTPTILHFEKKGRRLDALEELEILSHKDSYLVNDHLYPSRSPLLHFPTYSSNPPPTVMPTQAPSPTATSS